METRRPVQAAFKAEGRDGHRWLDWHAQLAGSGMEAAQTPVPQVLLSGSLVTFLGACQEDSSRALTTCSRMSGQ